MTFHRVLEFVFAGVAVYFAWTIAAELFIEWYSGVEPAMSLSRAQRAWCFGSIVVLLLAAVVVIWRMPFRGA